MANKKRVELQTQQVTNNGWSQNSFIAFGVFFAIMFGVFLQTLNNMDSKWKSDATLMDDDSNPRLEYRPMIDDDRAGGSSRISFQAGNHSSWIPWHYQMSEFLRDYAPGVQSGNNVRWCTFSSPPIHDQVCTFDISRLGIDCTWENFYGYDMGHPCIALTLNRILDWTPITYNETEELPDDMPPELRAIAARKYAEHSTYSAQSSYSLYSSSLPDERSKYRMVWMSCDGENAADRENVGSIVYASNPGFPYYYFPYRNQTNYLSPLVMVQFVNLTRSVLINIECRLWAQNIEYNRTDSRGSVHFELLID